MGNKLQGYLENLKSNLLTRLEFGDGIKHYQGDRMLIITV